MQPTIDDNKGGHLAKWYILGRWTYEDADTFGGVHDPLGGFHRTSVGHQGDADGYVAIDTFFAKDHPATRIDCASRSSAASRRPRARP